MTPRAACLACLEQNPPALFEAALWIAAEHQPTLQPAEGLQRLNGLQQQVSQGLPNLPLQELGPPLLRRLVYTRECRELLQRHLGPTAELSASQLQPCDARSMLQRLSRNLRQLHQLDDDPLAALRYAERVLLLGTPTLQDHLARAEIYQQLDCPQGERFDLQCALLLSDDPAQHLQLSQRLRLLSASPALH